MKLHGQTFYFIYEFSIKDTFYTKLPEVYKHLLPPGQSLYPIPFHISIYEYYVSDGKYSYKYNQSIEQRFTKNPEFYKYSNRGDVQPINPKFLSIIDLQSKKWINSKGEYFKIPDLQPISFQKLTDEKIKHEMGDGIFIIEDKKLPRSITPFSFISGINFGIFEIIMKTITVKLKIFDSDDKKFTFPHLSRYKQKLETGEFNSYRIPYYMDKPYSEKMKDNPMILKLPQSP